MDSDRRLQLERRYDYGTWRGRSAHAPDVALRGVTLAGPVLSDWEIHRVDRKPGPPPRTIALWRRHVRAPEQILRVDLFELASIDGAHEYVLELLNEFEATEIRRQEQPAIGDVRFGTALVLLFARANIVVLLRNAGRDAVEVTGAAREIDVHLMNLLTHGPDGP